MTWMTSTRATFATITMSVAAAFALSAAIAVAPPASAAPAAAAASPAVTSARAVSPCALIGQGRIRGLRTRPAHVTVVLAKQRGDTEVVVSQCRRVSRWHYRLLWSREGHVGRAGFAPIGLKREGDGRTPTGVYTLGPAFGAGDPGSRTGYLRLRPNSCWGSTIGSARYNRYFRGVCGPADERMYNDVRGAYAQGMVIDYNTRRVRQGLGSAIFFHVSTGGATAGCVSVDKPFVIDVIQRTRPGDVIAMGTVGDLVRW